VKSLALDVLQRWYEGKHTQTRNLVKAAKPPNEKAKAKDKANAKASDPA